MSNMGMNGEEMEILGYSKVYDYTQFSHDNHINVIPEQSFKQLVQDTFKTITDVLRETYGPYGSIAMISYQNETTTTKDGFNVFERLNFSHHYKRMVYLAIMKICDRVNRNVGDGTTSCILVAEKIFNAINALIKTPDDKRNILMILNNIEQILQHSDIIEKDKENGIIEKLTIESLKNMINLAGNYDSNMTTMLMNAMNPDINTETGVVNSLRNVIVEEEVDMSYDSGVEYEVYELPGDYRVRVNMDVEFGLTLQNKTKMKIAMFDHAFSPSDWGNFFSGYDKETPTLILAPSFTRTFMDNEYVRYLRERALTHQDPKVYIAEIKGDFVQNEIKDLAAVLDCDVYKLHNQSIINHAELTEASVSVFRGNALCFYDVKSPDMYIKRLRIEMDKDLRKSYIKIQDYHDRIRALTLQNKDTLVKIKASTSLEVKMIHDKIDDCVAIVKSAFNHGVVPNLLVYGNMRINNAIDDIVVPDLDNGKSLVRGVCNSISDSIKKLFEDIWKSKYNDNEKESFDTKCQILYDMSANMGSYDIIKDQFVSVEKLPTSSQYDIEVIIAAISIVKYLLTSRALIFDAHLMTSHGDQGHYQQMGL